MEGLPQKTQASLSDEGLAQDVIGTLLRDFLQLLDTDIGWLFVAFYSFMGLCCFGLFWYSTKEKGLLRHLALACVLMCIFFSGFVASLAIMDLKQPRTIIERMEQARSGPNPMITGQRPESLGYRPVPEVAPLPEIVITPQLSGDEIRRRYERGYDADGNLLEDDLSHEDSYPAYRD